MCDLDIGLDVLSCAPMGNYLSAGQPVAEA
jgi:hypothetical protein